MLGHRQSLSLLQVCYPCLSSSCPILRTFSLSWFCTFSACCLHTFVKPEVAAAALRCLGLPPRRRHLGDEVSDKGSFGCSLCLLFSAFPWSVCNPYNWRMWLVSLRQPEVAAWWSGSRVSLLWALLMQMAAPAPQTTRRLLTVSSDVAKLLAVTTVSKSSLGLYASTLMKIW
jgi:hypothetical protein